LDQQAKNKIAFYQSTIGLLVADTTDSWGFAEVQLKGNQGGFRRAQDAYHTFENGLFTQGISTLGRFKVQGSFSLMRTAEDSLGNNLRGMREDIRPYYYFVQKPGEFERQTYHF